MFSGVGKAGDFSKYSHIHVTGSYTNVPWQDALEQILSGHGLKLVEERPGSGILEVAPRTRLRAFCELWRRANLDKDMDSGAFVDCHYDPKVIVCPQGDAEPPVYLVLYGFRGRHAFNYDNEYAIENSHELFPPEAQHGRPAAWDSPAIDAYTSDGKRVAPFGGNNVLDDGGMLADINGDGLSRASRQGRSRGGNRRAPAPPQGPF